LGVSVISFYISDDHELQTKDETVKTSLLLQKPGNVEVSSPVIQSFNNETTDTILKDQLIEDTFDFAVLEKNSVAKNKAVVAVIEKNPNESNFQPKEKSAEKIDFQGNNVIAEVNKNNLAKVEKILSASKENTSSNTGTEIQLVNEKIVTVDDQQIQSTEEKFELDDSKWVLEQPKKNITIQLMVLSKRESIQDVLKKNNKLRGKLKYFKKGVLDKTKYILIYGSYKNIATASKSMKKLPKKYRKSWLRKFKDLQKIIKN
jgi:DamX protein